MIRLPSTFIIMSPRIARILFKYLSSGSRVLYKICGNLMMNIFGSRDLYTINYYYRLCIYISMYEMTKFMSKI
jgi:hypothetical protein